MSIFNCYKTQPDGYARFEMLGKPMEGEFYRYDSFDDIDPKVGYIRPFDKVIRQQLIDNLQTRKGIDLQRFIAKDDLIICDAYVTDKHIQSPYQIVIDRFDFIDKFGNVFLAAADRAERLVGLPVDVITFTVAAT